MAWKGTCPSFYKISESIGSDLARFAKKKEVPADTDSQNIGTLSKEPAEVWVNYDSMKPLTRKIVLGCFK